MLVRRSYKPLWYLIQRVVTMESIEEFGAENVGMGKWILERRLVPRGKEYTRPVGSGKPISLNPVIGAHREQTRRTRHHIEVEHTQDLPLYVCSS
jgi:hypothetical protein